MTKRVYKSTICYSCMKVLLPLLLLTACGREEISENQDDNLPPAVPSGIQIYASHDGAVGIEWNRNQASNIKGYNIYRSVNSAADLQKVAFTGDTHFIDSPLAYDSTYYYAVSSVNNNNAESGLSSTVNAKPINLYSPLPVFEISISGRNNINSRFIRLEWTPRQEDYDVKGYEIYRSETGDVRIDTRNKIGFSTTPGFDDSSAVILKKYYYKIISVDNGNLKSDTSHSVSDLILDTPELIFPANNAAAKNLYRLQFKTAAAACRYKIIIQSNELYGTEAEYDFYSDKISEIISYDINAGFFVSYRRYFWRIITYTGQGTEPNSYSPLFSFVFVAE